MSTVHERFMFMLYLQEVVCMLMYGILQSRQVCGMMAGSSTGIYCSSKFSICTSNRVKHGLRAQPITPLSA